MDLMQGQEAFVLSKTSRPALASTHSHTEWELGILPLQ